MRKILSVMLAIVMILSVITIVPFAASGAEVDTADMGYYIDAATPDEALVDTGALTVSNLGNGFLAYITLNSTGQVLGLDGSTLVLEDKVPNDLTQMWSFQRWSDYSYKIMNAAYTGADGVITIGSTERNTAVGVATENAANYAGQHFYLLNTGHGYQIIPLADTTVDLEAADVAERGSAVEIYTNNMYPGSLFSIKKIGTNAPVITSIINKDNGAKLFWNPVVGVEKYRVFVKEGSKWVVLGDTNKLYFTHKTAQSGKVYTYTVRGIDGNGNYITGYDSSGYTNRFFATPHFDIANIDGGIKLSWGAVSGAPAYRVFIYDDSEKVWDVVGDTSATSMRIYGLSNGETHTYAVKVISATGANLSGHENHTHTFYDIPVIDVVNTNAGPRISWNRISGVNRYRIFIKTGNKWKTIGESTTDSFVFTGARYNVSYTYTVRGLSDNGREYVTDYDHVGKTARIVATPNVSVKVITDGVYLSWNAVDGAGRYAVYAKLSGADQPWVKVGYTTDTDFTIEGLSSGSYYKFTVRAVTADGALLSGYKASRNVRYFRAPFFTSVTTTHNNRTLEWEAINDAPAYRVFVKRYGKWVKIADTKDTYVNYTMSDAPEQNMIFAVRVISAGGSYLSDYYITTAYFDGTLTAATHQ